MIKRQLFFILLLQCLISWGQVSTDRQNGYIVKPNLDTIYGEMLMFPFDYLSSNLKFKTSGSDIVVDYSPDDLKGFHIEPDMNFVSIPINEIKRKEKVSRSYFVLKAVSGEIELLVLYSKHGEERFFINNDELGIAELKKVVNVENGIKKEIDLYKIELGKYLSKDLKFQKQISESNFNYKSLSSIIDGYNLQQNQVSSIYKNEWKLDWKLSAVVGGHYYWEENDINYLGAKGITIGVNNEFYNTKRSLKFGYIVGLRYSNFIFNEKRSYWADQYGKSYDLFTLKPESDLIFTEQSLVYRKSSNIIEFPLSFEYNNKTKFISPLFKGGFEPYVRRDKEEIGNYIKNESSWKPSINFILGIGCALNYDRFNLKYDVSLVKPLLKNSIELTFLINK